MDCFKILLEVVADGERNYRRQTRRRQGLSDTFQVAESHWSAIKRHMSVRWMGRWLWYETECRMARLLIKLFAQEMTVLVTSGTRLLHRELIPLASIMFLWSEMNSQRANSAQQTSCLDFLFPLFRQSNNFLLGLPEFFSIMRKGEICSPEENNKLEWFILIYVHITMKL